MADASLDALVRFLPYLRTCSSLMRAQVSAIHTLSGRSSELAQLASTLKKWEERAARQVDGVFVGRSSSLREQQNICLLKQ